jgi:hypothetical protein
LDLEGAAFVIEEAEGVEVTEVVELAAGDVDVVSFCIPPFLRKQPHNPNVKQSSDSSFKRSGPNMAASTT